MTTVAYKDGIIAADTLATNKKGVSFQTSKIRKIDGMLIGISGSLVAGTRAINYLSNRNIIEKLRGVFNFPGGDYSGIFVTSDGELFLIDGGPKIKLKSNFYSIGTGSSYAMGAMSAGATAEEAVRISIEYDHYSAGDVQKLRNDMF